MSIHWFHDVLEFHRRFGCKVGEYPAIPDSDTRTLRMSLLNEERDEIEKALEANDVVALADGIGDLIYVATGFAVTAGIYLPRVWNVIHASNMAKVGGAKRADGKILKPPGWTPPDIGHVLRTQWNLSWYDAGDTY